MKTLIATALLMAGMLSGCQTTKLVPVYTMPTAPTNLTATLPDLQTIKKPGTSDAK